MNTEALPKQTGLPTILIVDDEPRILESTSLLVRSAALGRVLTLQDGRQAAGVLESTRVDAVVLDLRMPHISGQDLLTEIKKTWPSLPVVVMTAMDQIDTAVECMRLGAQDYLVKPVSRERFITTLRKTIELSLLRAQVTSLRQYLLEEHPAREDAFSGILTRNERIRSIFQYLTAVAPSPEPVLITGETGVGKELMARAIHGASGRRGELVAVNVAGLDDEIFSDTLFGHLRGAFTGAEGGRDGLVARAGEGTLFLDEIGDLQETSQRKLLRLVQEGEYYPVGADVPRRSTARVVVATNRDLHAMVQRGLFRRDLYYRLRTHQVDVPPLRQRREDIPLLIEHFLGRASRELGQEGYECSVDLLQRFETYEFPGNVRELEALVHDAVARCSAGNPPRHGEGEARWPVPARHVARGLPTLKELEDGLVAEALRRSGGNQGAAAMLLGISRQALNQRLRRKTSASNPGGNHASGKGNLQSDA